MTEKEDILIRLKQAFEAEFKCDFSKEHFKNWLAKEIEARIVSMYNNRVGHKDPAFLLALCKEIDSVNICQSAKESFSNVAPKNINGEAKKRRGRPKKVIPEVKEEAVPSVTDA